MGSLGIFLVVLVVLAALFIVVPVWRYQKGAGVVQGGIRREQNIEVFRQTLADLEQNHRDGLIEDDEFEKLKVELEKNLLHDMSSQVESGSDRRGSNSRLVPLLLVLFIPFASVLLYRSVGSANELALPELLDAVGMAQTEAEQLEALNQVAEVLEVSFRRDRDNIQAGYSLGTLYLNLNEYEDAVRVFSQLAAGMDDNNDKATVLGQLAQAQYLADDSSITPAVQATMDDALAINSNQPAVMSLLAVEAFVDGNYQEAISYWRRQISQLPVGSPQIAAINETIALVEQNMGMAETPQSTTTDSNVKVTVNVSIDESIRDSIPPGMRVFVFARSESMPVPLAAQSYMPEELPVTVTLDDSMAMTPQFTLSSAETVYVAARIASQATAESDLEAVSEPFVLAEQEEAVDLVIKDINP